MLTSPTPPVDPQLFAAAQRVTQWHRQRPSWRPISQPLPVDHRDAGVPLTPEVPPAAQGQEPEQPESSNAAPPAAA